VAVELLGGSRRPKTSIGQSIQRRSSQKRHVVSAASASSGSAAAIVSAMRSSAAKSSGLGASRRKLRCKNGFGPNRLAKVRQRKRDMVKAEVAAVLQQYESSGAELIMGTGKFVAPKTLEVRLNDGARSRRCWECALPRPGCHCPQSLLIGYDEAMENEVKKAYLPLVRELKEASDGVRFECLLGSAAKNLKIGKLKDGLRSVRGTETA
jgi:hypothetical protein